MLRPMSEVSPVVRLSLVAVAALLIGVIAEFETEQRAAEAAFPGTNGKIAYTVYHEDSTEGSDIYVMNPDGSGETPLISGPTYDSDPAWSPDGTKIAFVRKGPGVSDVWVAEADGSNPQQLTNDPDASAPSWSPDGDRIVFLTPDALKIADVSGGGTTPIPGTSDFRQPVWSPNGDRIATTGPAGPFTAIFLVDLSGNATQLTMNPVTNALDWSPDGSEIVFRGTGPGPSGLVASLHVIDVESGEVRQIAEGGGFGLAWSPDGTQIVYDGLFSDSTPDNVLAITSAEGGGGTMTLQSAGHQVYDPSWQPIVVPSVISGVEFTQGIQELQTIGGLQSSLRSGGTAQPSAFPGSNGKIAYDNFEMIKITEASGAGEQTLTNGRDPAWSPDSKRIAFTRIVDGVQQIHVMEADGSGVTQLTSLTDHAVGAAWSPDGTKIAFASQLEIWVMNADGSGLMSIIGHEDAGAPAWSPDGSKIAFGHGYDVWVVNASGGPPIKLTNSDGNIDHLAPSWSPDGSQIVFEIEGEIHVMSAGGGGSTKLADGQDPSWSPDGTKIAFESNATGEIHVIDATGGNETSLGVVGRNADWGSLLGVVHSVEFTQGIQELQTVAQLQSDVAGDGQPPVPIVGDKPGVMRVYFDEVEEVTPYVVKVSGFPDVNVILEPGCTPEKRRKQEDDCVSVDFYFVREAGPWDVTLEVEEPFGALVEQHEFNLTLVETKPLEIVAVPVCDGSGCGVAADLAPALDLLRATYPGGVDLTIETSSQITRATTTGNGAWWNKVLTDLKALRAADGVTGDVYYHGVVRTGAGGFTGAGILGMGYQPGFEGATRIGANATNIDGAASPATEQVVAHEVGHNLGRKHVPTVAGTTCYGTPTGLDANWPHPNPLIHEVGFDVATGKVRLEDDYTDLMAYCLPGWTSVYQYNAILNSALVPSGGPASPQGQVSGDFWEISGSIDGAEATLDPLFNVKTTADTGAGVGSFRIEVRDSGNGLLFTRMFEPSGGHWAGVVDVKAFSELVPIQAGAASITVFDPFSTVLAELELDGTAPTVEFNNVSPSGSGGETVTASWVVTDPDSVGHTYRLDFSTDGGTTWSTLIPHLEEPSVDLDSATLPGTSAMQLRVQASDGAATGSATSNVFEVPEHAPQAEIISPKGDSFALGQVVWLEAVAYDVDDGTLEDGAVSWSSSRDGNLGTGASLPVTDLSAGTHTITMTATDSDDNEVTDSITITVAEASLNEGAISGDVDCNGVVNAVDGLKVLQHVAGLPVDQTQPCPQIGSGASPFGDVNCDGAVSAVDALTILQFVAALAANLPPGCPEVGA